MELLFLLFCLAVIGSWAVIVVIAMTVSDVKTIALEKEWLYRPHARKWRGVTTLRKTLHMDKKGDSPSRSSIRFAEAYFQKNPSTRFVEIITAQEFPQTLTQFFATYHRITLAPFVKVRAIMDIYPDHQLWPILARNELVKKHRDTWYSACRWLLSSTNLALLIYVSFIAVTLGQPEYLLAYIGTFCVWLVWSILSYPAFGWRQKIAYVVLAPASLGYFLWRVLLAPFAPLRKIPLTPILHRVLS